MSFQGYRGKNTNSPFIEKLEINALPLLEVRKSTTSSDSFSLILGHFFELIVVRE